jgi:hypothetical protein
MTGIELIAEERGRQVAAEGYTPEHDDGHLQAELANGAIAYALAASEQVWRCTEELDLSMAWEYWPWGGESWKPSPDPVRNLVKAGALIAAEIDRIQRGASGG